MANTNDKARPQDLIAKASHVSLKNTLKVLHGLREVAEFRGVSVEELIREEELKATRANRDETVRCNTEYSRFENFMVNAGRAGMLFDIQALEVQFDAYPQNTKQRA